MSQSKPFKLFLLKVLLIMVGFFVIPQHTFGVNFVLPPPADFFLKDLAKPFRAFLNDPSPVLASHTPSAHPICSTAPGGAQLTLTPNPPLNGRSLTLTLLGLSDCQGNTVTFSIRRTESQIPSSSLGNCTIDNTGRQCSLTVPLNISFPPNECSHAFIFRAGAGLDFPTALAGGALKTVQVAVTRKSATPFVDPTSVTLPSGKVCNLSITHFGRDDTDRRPGNADIAYETATAGMRGTNSRFRTITMTDDADANPPACDNDLVFSNEWTPRGGVLRDVLTMDSKFLNRNAAHNLTFGYQISTNACVFSSSNSHRDALNKAVANRVAGVQQSCSGNCVGFGRPEYGPTLRTAAVTHLSTQSVPNSSSVYNFLLVECLGDQHCSNPTPFCNLSTNTCQATSPDIEKTSPTITINTQSDQWYKDNPVLDLDFEDNQALKSGAYQVDCPSGKCPESSWTPIFSNDPDKNFNTVSDLDPDFKIPQATWSTFADGSSHIIYFQAEDDAGNKTGHDSSVSLVIKKDTTPPVSSITNITRISPDPGAPGIDSQNRQWLKAGTYSISTSDTDGGSGVDLTRCDYLIQDATANLLDGTSRGCGSTFEIRIGSATPSAQCVTQGINACVLTIGSRDRAGNTSGPIFKLLNVDITPPTTQ